VMNYPKAIKAFYMRVNDDGRTVAAMDVLAPGIGEIIGGSQREERLEVLDCSREPAEARGIERRSADQVERGSWSRAGADVTAGDVVEPIAAILAVRDLRHRRPRNRHNRIVYSRPRASAK